MLAPCLPSAPAWDGHPGTATEPFKTSHAWVQEELEKERRKIQEQLERDRARRKEAIDAREAARIAKATGQMPGRAKTSREGAGKKKWLKAAEDAGVKVEAVVEKRLGMGDLATIQMSKLTHQRRAGMGGGVPPMPVCSCVSVGCVT